MKAYLIPGSGEDLKSRNYKAVLEVYKNCGYEPEFIPITWKYRTIDHWLREIKAKIPKEELANSLLSGFSFGAMIALALSAEANPKQLLLFSVSPYFNEDMPLDPRYIKWAGQRRIDAFEHIHFNELAARIYCETFIFLGDMEKKKYKNMWHRAGEARKRISNSELILVDDVGHDVGDPNYIAAIEEALKNRTA
jgi:esterase/lipase